MNSKKVLFIGGHHNSAIPVINELQKEAVKIVFVGHKFASSTNSHVSSEYKEITSLGINYINFSSPKFYKIPGLKKYYNLLNSIFRAAKILSKEKPQLVFSFGGYMAVPFAIASRVLNIDIVTHEQTYDLGLANRVVALFSKAVFLTWPNKKYSKSRYIISGMPLRPEILKVKRKQTKKLKTLFVQGGKQGSHVLNTFIFDNLEKLTKKYTVYHQTSKHSGSNDHITGKELSKKYYNYKPFEYMHGQEYTDLLNKSDFVVSRSGAHFTYEMCYLKMPCIFVPIPWSSRNEQEINAGKSSLFTNSTLIRQDELSFDNLQQSIHKLKTNMNKKSNYLDLHPEKSVSIIIEELQKIL